MTATPPDHVHISEREADGSWEDCLWDSALEWYRVCVDARKPATHAEAQLIRHASGEPTTGGSNMGDLSRGFRVRYGYVLPSVIASYTALKEALVPGKAAVVSGSMRAFNSVHRLSVHSPNFDGGHAVFLMNISGTLLWCDPLAPAAAAVPVTVTWAEVSSYVRALSGGEHVVGTIRNLPPKESPDMNMSAYLPGYTAKVKPTSNIRSGPSLTAAKLHTLGTSALAVPVVGTVVGQVDPDSGSNIWYLIWHESRVEYTAKFNIADLKPPITYADDGFTQATQDAAVTAATAPLQVAVAKLARSDALRAALQEFLVG